MKWNSVTMLIFSKLKSTADMHFYHIFCPLSLSQTIQIPLTRIQSSSFLMGFPAYLPFYFSLLLAPPLAPRLTLPGPPTLLPPETSSVLLPAHPGFLWSTLLQKHPPNLASGFLQGFMTFPCHLTVFCGCLFLKLRRRHPQSSLCVPLVRSCVYRR